MSKIRTAAIGAALTLGFAVAAGAQTQTKPEAGQRQGRGEMRGHRGGGRGGEFGRGRRGARHGGRLMADLKLTDAQKTSIKAIHTKYQPQYAALRDQVQGQFQRGRLQGQQRDTSAAARQRFQQQREAFRQRSLAIRTQEQNEIRGILTAEQRTKWDAAQADRKKRLEARGNKQGRGQRRGFRAGSKA